MKPPICEVCDDFFDPDDGALVRFGLTDRGAQFVERQRADGIVGHAPDDGWFCGSHFQRARQLAAEMTLREAVSTLRTDRAEPSPSPAPPDPSPTTDLDADSPERDRLGRDVDRWSQRHDDDGNPICLACGKPFDADTGGRTLFRLDAAGAEWNLRLSRGEESGDRPSAGWFCTRHIGPASLISNQLTKTEAMPLLVPDGRSPLEYREHPDGVEITADEYGEPSRAPFTPVSLEFDPQWSTGFAITPQATRDAHTLLARSVQTIGAGLGIDHFRAFGTSGSFSSYQSNEFSAFLIRETGSTLILQRREATILEIAIRPGEPQRVAPDGAILVDRLEVRAADAETVQAVRDELDALIARLSEDVPDPFDLAPDLVGVDLHRGELRRGYGGRPGHIRWEIAPVQPNRLVDDLVQLLPSLVELLGVRATLDGPPELASTTERSFNPIDGARPPHCPFTDVTKRRGVVETETGTLTVALDDTANNWSDVHVANVSVSLHVRLGERTISASFSGEGATCSSLLMSRPAVSGSIQAIATKFSLISE